MTLTKQSSNNMLCNSERCKSCMEQRITQAYQTNDMRLVMNLGNALCRTLGMDVAIAAVA